MKKKIIFLSLMIVLMITKVNAASEYYDNIWIGSQGSKSDIVYGINDIVETKNGYLAVGPYDPFNSMDPTVYVLDKNGKATTQINLENYVTNLYGVDVLRLVEIDGYYYAITASDYNSKDTNTGESIYDNYIIKLDEKGKVLDSTSVQTRNFSIGTDYADVEMILKESEEYIYVTNNNKDQYIRISKKDLTGTQISFDNIPEEDKEVMEDLVGAITDYYVMSEYKDGYFVFIEDIYDEEDNYVTSIFGYYNEGEIVWETEIYYWSKYMSEGTTVEYNDLLIFVNYNKDKDPVLITIDENGKILEENKMATYYENIEDYDYYNFQHILPAKKGFFITGSYVFLEDKESEYLDERLSQSAPMYFQKKYIVTTKTDGNGNVTSSQEWGYGSESVTFVVTPNEGYVLGVAKVTDSDGNVIEFTENTFTMPNADVIIEVTFTKIPVEENPETSDIILTISVISFIIGGIVIYKNKKRLNWLK